MVLYCGHSLRHTILTTRIRPHVTRTRTPDFPLPTWEAGVRATVLYGLSPSHLRSQTCSTPPWEPLEHVSPPDTCSRPACTAVSAAEAVRVVVALLRRRRPTYYYVGGARRRSSHTADVAQLTEACCSTESVKTTSMGLGTQLEKVLSRKISRKKNFHKLR